MDRNVAAAIRQQSEDLRDELKELEQWEDVMKARESAKAQRKAAASSATAANVIAPPIRGTVPSLKEAVRQQHASSNAAGATAKTAEADPIQQAKEKGNALFQAGHLQEAVAAYTAGIDLDPASSITHVLYANRAMCYLKLGQWAAAEKDATTCVQMNTGYAKAYYRRAIARKNLHKLKDARADLEAVLALAPKDVSAQQEMAEVTKALQGERAAAATVTPAASGSTGKKRIVIEEVDSEDDEGQPATAATTAPALVDPAAAAASKLSAEEQQLRQARIDEDFRKLAAAREEHEAQVRLAAQRTAQTQAQRQRRNQRVEIVEEVEEEQGNEAAKGNTTVPAPSTPAAPAAAPALPTPLTPTSTTPVAAPASAATSVHLNPAPSSPSSSTSSPSPSVKSKSSLVVPRPRPAISKESLTTPNTFTEFERRFRDVEQNTELRNYYVSLLRPDTLKNLFGSNMTPEMLICILQAVKTFDGATALQFAKGLSQVSRIEDLTLFFNAKEKEVVQEVLNLLKSSGASEKEMQAVQRKLKPF